MRRNRRVTRLVSEGCDWCGAAMQPLRGGEGGVVGIPPSHGSGVRWCQRATALVTASADQLGPVLLAAADWVQISARRAARPRHNNIIDSTLNQESLTFAQQMGIHDVDIYKD